MKPKQKKYHLETFGSSVLGMKINPGLKIVVIKKEGSFKKNNFQIPLNPE